MPQNDSIVSDMEAAQQSKQYEANQARIAQIRQKRAQQEQQDQGQASTSQDGHRPNGVTDGQTIWSEGLKAKGLPDDWQPPSGGPYAGYGQIDEIFDAGLQATGSSRAEYNIREFRRAATMMRDGLGAIAKDVGGAAIRPADTLKQVPAGMIDAWNEINKFGASLDALAADTLGYWPALQVFDADGDFHLAIRNLQDIEADAEAAGQELGTALTFENPIDRAETATGNLVRGLSQFAVPFTASNKALKANQFLAKPGAWREMSRFALAGFAADFAGMDPYGGRMTDMLDEAGVPVVEWLRSDPDDSEMEARFKNGIEGLGIGAAADLLFNAMRGFKAMKQVETDLNARVRDMEREDREAAELIERDIYSQGDPNGEALIIERPPQAQTTAERAEAAVIDTQRIQTAELDGLMSQARDTVDASPELTERVTALQGAARTAFGSDYDALEQSGRVLYARQAGDIDPAWTEYNSAAQAVTLKDGKVVVFANTTKPEQMEGILLHEVGIHSGMEAYVGTDGFDAMLSRVDELVLGGDEAAVEARAMVPDSTNPQDITHETLAYMVQYAESSGVVRDLVGRMKSEIATRFPGAIERLKLTEPDFRQMAYLSLRRQAIMSGEMNAVFTRSGVELQEGEAQPQFAIKETPGRLDKRLKDLVVNDIKSGRRGLAPDEADALLGAAERWTEAVRRQQPSRSQGLNDLIQRVKSQNDPDDMAQFIEIVDGAKASMPEPPSLMTFLRRQGGVRDDGGELAARDLGRVKFTNNTSGLTMDEALERAWEAGYVGKPMEGDTLGPGARPADETRPTFNDLLDAIDRELSGEKVYSINDLDWVQEAAARADLRAHIESLNIDPTKPKKQIVSEYERIALLQAGEPVTLKDIEAQKLSEGRAGALPGIGLPNRGLLGGNDIKINFNAINSGDDIRSVMGQLADAFADEVRDARGPVRSNKQIIKDSKRLSAFKALNERGDKALTDTEVPAAQALYIASTENVKQALELASKQGTETAHYNARRALTVHRAIQAEIAGAKADASRALRAWSVSQSATAQARRELNGVLEAYGGKLDPSEIARMRSLLEKEPTKFDDVVRLGRYTSDVLGEVLRFAWLSGPHTHVMNMAGNMLTMHYDIAVRLGSAVKGKITGDAALEHQLQIAAKEYQGMIAGIRAQFSAFAKRADYGRMGRNLREAQAALRGGNVRQGLMKGASAVAFDNPVSATFRGRFDDRGVSGMRKFDAPGADRAISAGRMGVSDDSMAGKLINGSGAVLSAPTDFLGFQDDFFKGVNELATRYRKAQEIVLEEAQQGLARDDMRERFAELVRNPPVEVLEEGRQVAQRRTFTEPVGEGTKAILTLRNYLNKLGLPVGHVLFPFVVTPSNILKFAFQNGPSGTLFQEMREDWKAGGEKRAMVEARWAAGTALLITGMDMVANGHMTGMAPSDPGERELWARQGRQPYSIKVGDKWISYLRLEPVSTMMAIGADMQTLFLNSSLDERSDEDISEIVGPAMGAAINIISSKSYLTGASEFISFAEDPTRYGSSYIENLTSGIMVPALIGQIEKIDDPVLREASSITERALSRVPGFSKDLPPSRDLWGRVRHVSSGMGEWYDALSPFTIRTQDSEPIDTELMRIGYYPKRPSKTVTVQTPSGLPVAVSLRNRPDIWSRYVALAGNEAKVFEGMGTKDYLNAVIAGKHSDARQYQVLPDSPFGPISKERFIERRIEMARKVARMQIQQEFKADLQAMAQASIQAKQQAEALRLEQLTR